MTVRAKNSQTCVCSIIRNPSSLSNSLPQRKSPPSLIVLQWKFGYKPPATNYVINEEILLTLSISEAVVSVSKITKLHQKIVIEEKNMLKNLPTPRSSTVGLSIHLWACSILPSKWTAALTGLVFATALLVLDCKFWSDVAICLANARASGESPFPLRI